VVACGIAIAAGLAGLLAAEGLDDCRGFIHIIRKQVAKLRGIDPARLAILVGMVRVFRATFRATRPAGSG